MSTVSPKQRILNRLWTVSKGHAEEAESPPRPVLDQLLFAVCREGSPQNLAEKAFRQLQEEFFDWNEVRVSSVREVADALAGLPQAEARAVRIIGILQEIFETTYSFDLESLHKKGLKQAQKQLERLREVTPFAVAYTLQNGLGGHAIPLDDDMCRTLRRLELIDGDQTGSSSSLEHLIPKSRGVVFRETVSHVAHEFCYENDPRCKQCPMGDACPTGIANLRKRSGSTRGSASRSRSR